jgi:hypothetical protein
MKFFEFEQIEDPKRVKLACTKLKGHASLVWDNVQLDMQRNGKDKIKAWDKMVAKLKGKFLLVDYSLTYSRSCKT